MHQTPARTLHLGIFVGQIRLDLGTHFFMDVILECFRGRGHTITIITPRTPVPAELDAGLLHVAATVVPAKILARLPPGLPVLNQRVHDISKRRVSRMLLNQGDVVSGPVIVKSDANYAGLNDFARLGRLRRRWRSVTTLLRHARLRPAAIPYEIYPAHAEVPQQVWTDRTRVVERFVPERLNGRYCLRKWVFLGDADQQVISVSDHPVIKATNATHSFTQEPPHETLRAERRRLGFDYGKFDYVMFEGRPVLLDANSTPGISARSPQLLQSAEVFAEALERWVLRRLQQTVELRSTGCAPV